MIPVFRYFTIIYILIGLNIQCTYQTEKPIGSSLVIDSIPVLTSDKELDRKNIFSWQKNNISKMEYNNQHNKAVQSYSILYNKDNPIFLNWNHNDHTKDNERDRYLFEQILSHNKPLCYVGYNGLSHLFYNPSTWLGFDSKIFGNREDNYQGVYEYHCESEREGKHFIASFFTDYSLSFLLHLKNNYPQPVIAGYSITIQEPYQETKNPLKKEDMIILLKAKFKEYTYEIMQTYFSIERYSHNNSYSKKDNFKIYHLINAPELETDSLLHHSSPRELYYDSPCKVWSTKEKTSFALFFVELFKNTNPPSEYNFYFTDDGGYITLTEDCISINNDHESLTLVKANHKTTLIYSIKEYLGVSELEYVENIGSSEDYLKND